MHIRCKVTTLIVTAMTFLFIVAQHLQQQQQEQENKAGNTSVAQNGALKWLMDGQFRGFRFVANNLR